MAAVGRRRAKDLSLPAGVRLIGERLFWQPSSARERQERREKALPASVPLGAAVRVRGRLVLTTAQGKAWAELSGVNDTAEDGTVGQLVQIWKRDAIGVKADGSPRSPDTIRTYRYAIPAVLKRFGNARYGRSNIEAANGKAIGPADIKRFIRSGSSKAMGNLYLAVLNNAFVHTIGEGFTVYNPCEDVAKNGLRGRTRAPAPWEFECLRTLAKLREGLIMDFEKITGDRIREVLRILRAHGGAEGIIVTRKGGKVEVWDWTPSLRSIWDEALKIPGATPFPKSPLFPGRRGKPFTYSGFNTAWQALKVRTNHELAAGIVDPDTLELHPGLAIDNLHFHDWRSKVHDDAVDKKRDGAEQIGDTKQVASRHYARRPVRKVPLE
jgi:integrase